MSQTPDLEHVQDSSFELPEGTFEVQSLVAAPAEASLLETLSAALLAAGRPGFLLAFALLGAGSSGYMLSAQTLVLEFGSAEDIPMRLGVSATVETSVAAIGPLIGGALAGLTGLRPLIEFSLAAMVAATLLVWLRVGEPRVDQRHA